jgi:tRNA 2-thiouridine synthesizing protein A
MPMISQSIDTRGLNCPLPILKARCGMETLLSGQKLEVFSSDPGSFHDIDALCRSTGNTLISSEDQTDGSYRFIIEIN